MTYEGVRHEGQSKIVPLMTLHWWRQAEHWKYSRPSRRNELWTPHPQSGHRKPCGQRDSTTAASQSSSLPYRCMNSAIERPG
jgi:hypothetical protein